MFFYSIHNLINPCGDNLETNKKIWNPLEKTISDGFVFIAHQYILYQDKQSERGGGDAGQLGDSQNVENVYLKNILFFLNPRSFNPSPP